MVLPTGGRKPGIPGQSRNELTDRILALGSTLEPIPDQVAEIEEKSTRADSRVFDVRAYGAVGDGSTDDTTAIQEAIDAAETAGGGVVFFPKGNYRILSGPLVIDEYSITLRGCGRAVSRIVAPSGAGDLLHLNDTPYNLKFEHMGFAAVSGHVFVVEESLVHATWFEVSCIASSNSHSVLQVAGSGANYIDNLWMHCETSHTLTATVPTFNLVGTSINNNRWCDMRVNNSGNYTWWIESVHTSGGYAYGNVIERITGEVLNGGAVMVKGGHGTRISDFDVWDLSAPASKHLFALETATTGGNKDTKYTTLSNVRRIGGSLDTGIYDLYIGSGGGNSPTTLIECGGAVSTLQVRDAGRITQINGNIAFSTGTSVTRLHGDGHLFSHRTTFNQPILLPRFTTTQRNALTDLLEGHCVYDTTLNKPVYYDGSAWTDASGTPV